MELSERAIRDFEKEDFVNVYEHQDAPGRVYKEHSHPNKTSIFVTDGSITFNINGQNKEIIAPRRFNIPANTPHSAIVGSDGMIAIMAE